MYLSVPSAITKYRRLGGLQMEIYFLRDLEARSSKIKVLENLVSGAGSFPGLRMAVFLPCSHMTCPIHVCGERALWCLFFLCGHQSCQIRALPYNLI